MLGNGAAIYYHLDELPSGDPRLASLLVFNGTNVVGVYPSLTTQAANTAVAYTWLSGAKATPSSASPTAVTVGVPPLILPPGYALTSRTDQLQPTDQWSDIRIWWDDAYQNLLAGYNPYGYPPGALLVFKQLGAAP